MKDKSTQSVFFIFVAVVSLLSLNLPASAFQCNIGGNYKFAWSETAGWMNFNPAYGGVVVHDTHLSGFAWAENIGWIKLGADAGGPYANTSAEDWGVNRDVAGNLSGYGWSETAGWINFNPTDSLVTIDPVTRAFDGYAWGENIGYVHFKNADPSYQTGCFAGLPWLILLMDNN